MSSDSSDTRRVVCFHGLIADVLTSTTDKNPSRRFHRCPNEDNNLLEKQLKCTKYSESLLAEKLELKENEIIRLQNKNDDLEKTIAQLELKENEMFRLQNKNEDLEKTIHAMCKLQNKNKDLEKAIHAQLELKENEIIRLQNKNEELEKAIHAMCKRKKIERKLILLVLVFCVAMFCNGVGNGNGRLMLK
ncbi:hypothetical protein STAS_31655 [Striga asiatica]|uniref:Uncharacterized protein n=1 Tax=Striga asiatica TaxID=4170 RepID=A0A5A7R9G6_STRAF|nr:hypothetical protein STAS_31655 [Striga asiatica]